MTTLRSQVFGLALLFLLGVRAAEASLLSERYVASWAPAGFFPLNAPGVQVRGIQNEAGAPASFDYAAYLAEQLRRRLSASGVSIVESGGANAVSVQITIHLYQEGSAFGRWLLPGAGATYAVVRAEFLWLAGCAISAIPNEPAAMVPGSLSARIPASARIFVEQVALESAAKDGTTPFDRWSGSFPLLQPQGLDNYRQGIRLTLQAAGAPTSAVPEVYVLRPSIQGGLAIPHAEAYAVLFVHYELEDRRTGTLLWAQTVYSQAKLENAQKQTANTPVADPAYGRLAAANLRQMANSLATWFAHAKQPKDKGN